MRIRNTNTTGRGLTAVLPSFSLFGSKNRDSPRQRTSLSFVVMFFLVFIATLSILQSYRILYFTSSPSIPPSAWYRTIIPVKQLQPPLQYEPKEALILLMAKEWELHEFFERYSPQWIAELNTFARIRILVEQVEGEVPVHIDRELVDLLTTWKVELKLVHIFERNYPPIEKAFRGMAALSSQENAKFFLYSDWDTLIVPSRLKAGLEVLDVGNPRLYAGRPIHHCKCEKELSEVCEPPKGIFYCQGAFFAVSAATMDYMQPRWMKCLEERNQLLGHCNSSDSLLGWCFNHNDIRCSPWKIPNEPELPSGVSWAEVEDGKRKLHLTSVCQNKGHSGGVEEVGHLGYPEAFNELDTKHCLSFHPTKLPEIARYLYYRVDPNLMHYHPPVRNPQCKLAIGIMSARGNYELREAIRQTWAIPARVVGSVELKFFIGKPSTSETMVVASILQMELQNRNDIVLVDYEDNYYTIWAKTLAIFQWGTQTSCPFIFKTDDDVYLRIIPLLRFLHQHRDERRSYFGKLWSGTTKISDKSHSWYLGFDYPRPTYPDFMGGPGYGMSSLLAKEFIARAALHPFYRIEDVGTGIVLEDLKRNQNISVSYYSPAPFFSTTSCTSNTILDNPSSSFLPNFYVRYTDDMKGQFCRHVDRSEYQGGHRKYDKTTFLSHPHRHFLSLLQLVSSTAPWNGKEFFANRWIKWNYINYEQKVIYRDPEVVLPFSKPLGVVDEARSASTRWLSYKRYHRCGNHFPVGSWMHQESWDTYHFLFLYVCPEVSRIPFFSYVQVADGALKLDQVAFQAAYSDHNTPLLYVFTTFACRSWEVLATFLTNCGWGMRALPGATHYLTVFWGKCFEDEPIPSKEEILELKSSFAKFISPLIELDIVVSREIFVKTVLLNRALSRVPEGYIAIALDVDMVIVDDHFFHRAISFVGAGGGVYFPIVFSRFNPNLIKLEKDPWLSHNNTIHEKTGVWRIWGFGNVAIHQADLATLSPHFDENIREWGQEDVDFAILVSNLPLKFWRAYDPGLIHWWHPKDCSKVTHLTQQMSCEKVQLVNEGTSTQLLIHYQKLYEKLAFNITDDDSNSDSNSISSD